LLLFVKNYVSKKLIGVIVLYVVLYLYLLQVVLTANITIFKGLLFLL